MPGAVVKKKPVAKHKETKAEQQKPEAVQTKAPENEKKQLNPKRQLKALRLK